MSEVRTIEITQPITRIIETEGENPIALDIIQPVMRISSLAVQGPPGPPGAGAAAPWQEAVFPLSGNQTVFPLPATPLPGTVSLFVNGLRQTNTTFSVTGATVTVTGFTPTAGDTVDITFQQ